MFKNFVDKVRNFFFVKEYNPVKNTKLPPRTLRINKAVIETVDEAGTVMFMHMLNSLLVLMTLIYYTPGFTCGGWENIGELQRERESASERVSHVKVIIVKGQSKSGLLSCKARLVIGQLVTGWAYLLPKQYYSTIPPKGPIYIYSNLIMLATILKNINYPH